MFDDYPSPDEVEIASPVALARWYRFLPSPGLNHIGYADFGSRFRLEVMILDRIIVRFNEAGGMTPAISKSINL